MLCAHARYAVRGVRLKRHASAQTRDARAQTAMRIQRYATRFARGRRAAASAQQPCLITRASPLKILIDDAAARALRR
jgi:hypothetical protein